MKNLFLLLLIAFTQGCLGQYPKLGINEGRVYNVNAQTKDTFDIVKINYYHRAVKYQRLMDKELNRLNHLKKPQLSQRLLDYQDSVIKYKLLLNALRQ